MKWTIPAKAVLIPYTLLALGILAVILWLRFAPSPLPVYVNQPGPTQYVPVPQKVVKVQTVTVAGPERVVLVPSVIVSEKMRWPEIANDNILAVGEVAPYRGKTSVVAVADIKDNTMTTRLISRQEPMPFWGLQREFHGGVYYGVAGENIVEGQVRATFLRTGPVVWQGIGRVGMERDGGRLQGALLIGAEF